MRSALQVTHQFLCKTVSKNCHLHMLTNGEADLPEPDQKKKYFANPEPSSATRMLWKHVPDSENYRLLRSKVILPRIPSLDVPLRVNGDSWWWECLKEVKKPTKNRQRCDPESKSGTGTRTDVGWHLFYSNMQLQPHLGVSAEVCDTLRHIKTQQWRLYMLWQLGLKRTEIKCIQWGRFVPFNVIRPS